MTAEGYAKPAELVPRSAYNIPVLLVSLSQSDVQETRLYISARGRRVRAAIQHFSLAALK